jgi:predicted ABC-class ATPase
MVFKDSGSCAALSKSPLQWKGKFHQESTKDKKKLTKMRSFPYIQALELMQSSLEIQVVFAEQLTF